MAEGGGRAAKARRGAAAACALAALLLMALAVCAALMWGAANQRLFEDGLRKNVDFAAYGMDEAVAGSFAAETIGYLRGDIAEWKPVVPTDGGVMPIPEDFTAHMATVRGWISPAKLIMAIGLALALALLCGVMLAGKRAEAPLFSTGGWYAGALAPVALIAGLGLWACIDFGSLWGWLHRTFIPDGIFAASEPIMRLFPAELFAGYIAPVGAAFGALAAAVLALPLLLRPLAGRLAGRNTRI